MRSKVKELDDDSYVRRLLNFECFAVSAFPELSNFGQRKLWDFELVAQAFGYWVISKDPSIIKISKAIEDILPGQDEFVWYRINKNKYAGIVLLYAILGFYKSRPGKSDKHGHLILAIMAGIRAGTYPTKAILDEINLTYYWDHQVMAYSSKVLQLENMSDAEFKALPEHDTWLNQN